MLYDIRLKLSHQYTETITGGRHRLCIEPLELPEVQNILASKISSQPEPTEKSEYFDFFGNRVHELSFKGVHEETSFELTAHVQREVPKIKNFSANIDELQNVLANFSEVSSLSPHHFLGNSERIILLRSFKEFSLRFVQTKIYVLDLVQKIGEGLFDEMSFDASVTSAETPPEEAFALRKGVCQDYSQIMIACLRSIGIPAGYVSGLIRTTPPPGKPRLEGADAMHAWVMVWCGPNCGWVEFDPTNNQFVGDEYILIARGRDYADVAPIKGVLRLSGNQSCTQAVDVIPIEESTKDQLSNSLKV